MRSVWLRSVAVIAAGAVVLTVVLFVASTVDARAPEVERYRLTQPAADDDRLALITSSIEVVFTEPVDPDSAAAAFSVDPDVAGSLSWSGATMTFTPTERLPLETAFVVRVDRGVRDAAGNASVDAAEPFSFATAGRPEVVDSEPSDGQTAVALEAPIALVFSASMDTASVEAALNVAPRLDHELVWAGERLEIVPVEPMRPGVRYQVRVSASAADLSGVTLAETFTLSFTTRDAGLDPELVMPADGTDGVAVTTPLAIVFDRPIDPDTVEDDLLTITPDVPGSLAVHDVQPTIVRFTPSSPLPANTTLEVELAPGLASVDGGSLAEPLAWSFTTGTPLASLGNQVLFLSDRAGITNLWAMNPDGTGQRQISAELASVVDYAVAPDGLSFVVADGLRLVRQRADGSDRAVLTEEGVIEFDPTYSPDGRQIAFGRADALTGSGLGLWQRSADGGDPQPVEMPDEIGGPSPAPSPSPAIDALLRAPRYAPDGQALAFVDEAGRVGVVELPAERLTTAAFAALEPPVWLPDSSGIVLAGVESRDAPAPREPGAAVLPLDHATVGDPPPAAELVIATMSRSGSRAVPGAIDGGAVRPAVDAEGRVAVIRVSGTAGDDPPVGGRLDLAAGPDEPASPIGASREVEVVSAIFTHEPGVMLLQVAGDGIWRLEIAPGELTQLSEDGAMPRWRP